MLWSRVLGTVANSRDKTRRFVTVNSNGRKRPKLIRFVRSDNFNDVVGDFFSLRNVTKHAATKRGSNKFGLLFDFILLFLSRGTKRYLLLNLFNFLQFSLEQLFAKAFEAII